jgi:hypothetical protein
MWGRYNNGRLSSMTDHESVKLQETSVAPEAEDLKFGFGAKIAGVVVLCAIGVFILLILITRAAYAFGSLAAFGILVALVLGAFWMHDRREVERARERLNS